MSGVDPWEVLGLRRGAGPVAVRRAYQRLARRFHPEVNPQSPEAAEAYRRVTAAYQQLVGAERVTIVHRRQRYETPAGRVEVDRVLEVREALTLHEAPEAPVSSAPRAELSVDLSEAIRGATASFSVPREVSCAECDGVGCVACSGHGYRVMLERLRVRVPAGVGDGDLLRVPYRGESLLLVVRVAPHAFFRREGLDILTEVPVTFAEAALGGEIEVATIDGLVRVRLPAGTPSGAQFRLRGRGVRRGERTGDHLYSVVVRVPTELDERTRALLQQLPSTDVREGIPKTPL